MLGNLAGIRLPVDLDYLDADVPRHLEERPVDRGVPASEMVKGQLT